MNLKRILAILGLIGWGVLISLTVIFAFIDTPATNNAFKGLIAADIILPVFIWVFMMIARRINNTRNDDNDKR